MTTHASALIPLLSQLALTGLSAQSVAARTYTCHSAVFRAEVYANDAVSVGIEADDVKKYCGFEIQDDSPMGTVSCDAVDVLAEVHAPKKLIIGVFESGLEKICQFSINGSLRSSSADATSAPKQIASFQDGVQAGLAYLNGIQAYAVASAQHDAEKARSASVQVLDRPDALIGSNVVNETGQALGELSGFAVNTDDHSLYAVLEVGGFLGLGTSEFAFKLDQMPLNENQQLMIAGLTESEIKTNKYVSSNYSSLDISALLGEDAITTVPTAQPVSYLFAAANSAGSDYNMDTLYERVNKHRAQISTCLYRFYAGLFVDVKRDDFSCAENLEEGSLEMAIDLDGNKYRLVVFR